jgi:hypothetical protein
VFDVEMIAGTLTVAKGHKVIDISSDTSLEIKFTKMPLPEFSASIQN